ncbi:hypothetical protein [Qipengyuania sp. ASV99]
MSHHIYHSSKPDPWSSPRPPLNPAIRAQAFGRVQPMHQPTWLERLFGMY